MGYEKGEQETSLVFNAEDDIWEGYCCYPPHITKILKILNIDEVDAKYEEGRESPLSITFQMKSNQVSFRKGEKRVMTEEQKEQARERIIKMHEAKKKKNAQK